MSEDKIGRSTVALAFTSLYPRKTEITQSSAGI